MDGEGRDFSFLRAKQCPVQKRIIMESEIGEIAVRLITSFAARRIEVWVSEGETVERGQRLGRILLGSTVVLEIPAAINMDIPMGAHVKAGETVLAARYVDRQ